MTAAVKPKTLAEALVAAQAEMPAVEPDAVNPHFRSKFVSLDHLIAKTRPVLNRHGLAIVQAPSHIDGHPALRTTLFHTSGESTTDTMPLLIAGPDMQKLGAALTYARRYAWAAALGICADEDDDGNAASAATKPAVESRSDSGGQGAAVLGKATAASAPSNTELRAEHDLLADTLAVLDGMFDATHALYEADAKREEAKRKNHAGPYRSFLQERIADFKARMVEAENLAAQETLAVEGAVA